MPKTPSWDSGTTSEPRVRMTASAHRTKMEATATALEPRDKDTTVTAAKTTTAPPMPTSSHRIRRRSSGDDRRYQVQHDHAEDDPGGEGVLQRGGDRLHRPGRGHEQRADDG